MLPNNPTQQTMPIHYTKNSTQQAYRMAVNVNPLPRVLAPITKIVALFSLCASLLISTHILAAEASTDTNTVASSAAKSIDLDARWFQVELILFSQQVEAALDAEQWPEIQGLSLPAPLLEMRLAPDIPEDANPQIDMESGTEPSAGNLAATEEALELPIPYQFLSADTLQLTDMAERIRRSSKRDLLLHISWQQPTYDRKKAVPIYFEAGMDKPLPIEEITEGETNDVVEGEILGNAALVDETNSETSVVLTEYMTEVDTNIGPQNPQFTGTVTLSVERYLHLAANLVYRAPVTQHSPIPIPDLELWYDRPYPTLKEPQGPAFQQMEWQAIRGFRLKESRRMRSKVMHYLDHPFMGLVVIITPIELPEPAEEIQQTSPQNLILTKPQKK